MSESDETDPATGLPFVVPFVSWGDDTGKCEDEDCRKTKDRVIRRINLRGQPRLCDECFDKRRP